MRIAFLFGAVFLLCCLGCPGEAPENGGEASAENEPSREAKPKPAETPEPTEPEEEPAMPSRVVLLRFDAEGNAHHLGTVDGPAPMDDIQPEGGEFLEGADLAMTVAEACRNAPKERGDRADGEDGPRLTGRDLPARLILRWNDTIGKCKVYVGQVLCNYDELGLERARGKMEEAFDGGAKRIEVDAGDDVPMRWVLEAIRLAQAFDPTGPDFTASQSAFDRAPMDLETYLEETEGGRLFPDVAVQAHVDPATPWLDVATLMMICARSGLYRIHLQSEGVEPVKAFLPRDPGVAADHTSEMPVGAGGLEGMGMGMGEEGD